MREDMPNIVMKTDLAPIKEEVQKKEEE